MSFVYIAAADDAGPCKIGISVDPAGRLSSLQTGNSARLVLVDSRQTQGTPLTERGVHDYLSGARILGEWFDVDIIQAQNALTAIENWGDSLDKPPPEFITSLAHDVELFCPPNPTIQQIIHLAALILAEPEWRSALQKYARDHRAKKAGK